MIKKLLAVILVFHAFSVAEAQVTKGSLFTGGRLEFRKQKSTPENSTDESTLNYRSFSPAFGVAVRNNLIVGADINYTTTKQDNTALREIKTVGGGLFVRKYLPIGKSFYFFADGRVGVDFIDDNYTSNFTFSKTEGYTAKLSFSPGLAYPVTRKFHIETGFSNMFLLEYVNHEVNTPGVTQHKKLINVVTAFSNVMSFNVGLRFLISK